MKVQALVALFLLVVTISTSQARTIGSDNRNGRPFRPDRDEMEMSVSESSESEESDETEMSVSESSESEESDETEMSVSESSEDGVPRPAATVRPDGFVRPTSLPPRPETDRGSGRRPGFGGRLEGIERPVEGFVRPTSLPQRPDGRRPGNGRRPSRPDGDETEMSISESSKTEGSGETEMNGSGAVETEGSKERVRPTSLPRRPEFGDAHPGNGRGPPNGRAGFRGNRLRSGEE